MNKHEQDSLSLWWGTHLNKAGKESKTAHNKFGCFGQVLVICALYLVFHMEFYWLKLTRIRAEGCQGNRKGGRIIIRSEQTAEYALNSHGLTDSKYSTIRVFATSLPTLSILIETLGFLRGEQLIHSNLNYDDMKALARFMFMKSLARNMIARHGKIFIHCFARNIWLFVFAGLSRRIIYYSHGLECKNFTEKIPKVRCLVLRTYDEMKIARARIGVDTSIRIKRVTKLQTIRRSVLVLLGGYREGRDPEELQRCISYFVSLGFRVYLKSHPLFGFEGSPFVASIKDDPLIEVVSDSRLDAEHLMTIIEPLFTVSWSSTALASALSIGSIPILLPNDSAAILGWYAYPFELRTTCWRSLQVEIIERLYKDESFRLRYLTALRKNARKEAAQNPHVCLHDC